MSEVYTEIGTMMRRSREDAPMSIEDASRRLHIRVRYLQALEAGKLDDLPGRAYAKGYLLAYADLLHMDKDELLRQFEKVEINQKRGFQLGGSLSAEKEASPRMIWGGLAVAVLAYLLWVLVMGQPWADKGDIDAWEQQSATKTHDSMVSKRNVACFRAQDVLYPPCYAEEPVFDVLPLKRRVVSIMELRM